MAHASANERITGAQALVRALDAEGVRHIFGYPGGQAVKIYDALYRQETIKHILCRHEQAAVHEADGYARSSGQVGVALVTSGPGATNTVTGIATAYMDSTPIVVITAQVPRAVIGTDSFQESDIFGITLPVVKHSYLVASAADLARIIHEAFHIASTGRPGPVLIDIPSDVLSEYVRYADCDSIDLPSYKPTYAGNSKQIKQAAKLIASAKRPFLLAGGGAVSSGAEEAVRSLVDTYRIPCATTLMGKGIIDPGCPYYLGQVGMHGWKYTNVALSECDVLIAVGTHFSDRVTGQIDTFAQRAKLVHIDIDPAEIGKVCHPTVPIVGDAGSIVTDLLEQLSKIEPPQQHDEWIESIQAWKNKWPAYVPPAADENGAIVPEYALSALSSMLHACKRPTIVTTDVGQNQMWTAQYVDCTSAREFISSGGLGTMGFGLPAALGAAVANPDKISVLITGDGGFQMNIQELATMNGCGAAVKMVILDNSALGMVRQWQKLFCGQRYAATDFTANPDFVALAAAYGIPGQRVTDPAQVEQALATMMQASGPYLLDIAISPEQSVYPMVAPGGSVDEPIGAIDAAVGAVGKGTSVSSSSSDETTRN